MSGSNTNLEIGTKLDGDVILTSASDVTERCRTLPDNDKDAHFAHIITRDGVRYAGVHIIVDMWGGQHIDDLEYITTSIDYSTNGINFTASVLFEHLTIIMAFL